MNGKQIHPETYVSGLHLNVSDLPRSLDYYQNALGLHLLDRDANSAHLGAGGNRFLSLTEIPGAKSYPRTTGLYHFAVLVPSRLELAKVLRHLAENGTRLEGWSDHLVSEALYLSDPDNIGIEIYRDRPRSEWKRTPDGAIEMATEALDAQGLLRELDREPGEWHGMHPQTRLGHIHLKVANIKAAEDFYCRILGFDLVARYGPSASFVSAGGYHHHIGMNVWESMGAPPPPPDAVGLRNFVVQLPDSGALEPVLSRVREARLDFDQRENQVFLHDPSQNLLVLSPGEK